MGYKTLFEKEDAFAALVTSAADKAGMKWTQNTVVDWSVGCQGSRTLLRFPSAVKVIGHVLMIDCMHTSYIDGKPGPLESKIDTEALQPITWFAREAIASKKRLLIPHSEIFPGTFASTTETADWLLRELSVKRGATLAWGPMKTKQLSEAKEGSIHLVGLAGNSATDHVDQLHALANWPDRLNREP